MPPISNDAVVDSTISSKFFYCISKDKDFVVAVQSEQPSPVLPDMYAYWLLISVLYSSFGRMYIGAQHKPLLTIFLVFSNPGLQQSVIHLLLPVLAWLDNTQLEPSFEMSSSDSLSQSSKWKKKKRFVDSLNSSFPRLWKRFFKVRWKEKWDVCARPDRNQLQQFFAIIPCIYYTTESVPTGCIWSLQSTEWVRTSMNVLFT